VRERSHDLFKPRIATERVPKRHQFQLAIAEIARVASGDAMLLNEFLKEHKRVEEQQVMISDLKKDLGVLTAQLKEQVTEIRKVSAGVEIRRPLTRVARTYPQTLRHLKECGRGRRLRLQFVQGVFIRCFDISA
jgi:hypothetical protein